MVTLEMKEKENNRDYSYLNPTSAKVIALYGAVGALLKEGADASQLKVADIAARAGIGKGTTYDYFKSREELIVKAMLYQIAENLRAVWEKVDAEENFQNKVYTFLDQIFNSSCKENCLIRQLLPLFSGGESMPVRFREELKKCGPPISEMQKITDRLYESAVLEGICSGGLSVYYVRTAFFNLLISYGIYRHPGGCPEEEMQMPSDEEEVKKRLYENLIYMLRSN